MTGNVVPNGHIGRQFDLTQTEVIVVTAMISQARRPEYTALGLAGKTRVHRSSAMGCLKRLEARGYLERTGFHKKAVVFVATTEGRGFLNAFAEARRTGAPTQYDIRPPAPPNPSPPLVMRTTSGGAPLRAVPTNTPLPGQDLEGEIMALRDMVAGLAAQVTGHPTVTPDPAPSLAPDYLAPGQVLSHEWKPPMNPWHGELKEIKIQINSIRDNDAGQMGSAQQAMDALAWVARYCTQVRAELRQLSARDLAHVSSLNSCVNCGTSDFDCLRGVRAGSGDSCCGRCSVTATHGQGAPGYVEPEVGR